MYDVVRQNKVVDDKLIDCDLWYVCNSSSGEVIVECDNEKQAYKERGLRQEIVEGVLNVFKKHGYVNNGSGYYTKFIPHWSEGQKERYKVGKDLKRLGFEAESCGSIYSHTTIKMTSVVSGFHGNGFHFRLQIFE